MPYKDKEKARAAKRRSDKKRSENRGEIWAVVAYPESVPDNWREILEELHVPIFISPLHDQDVNADGEKKKPHWHIEFMWESKKSLAQMKEIAEKLNAPIPKKQDSKRGCARYLCHLDNPDKAQYAIDDVVSLGGADYRTVIEGASDKYEVLHELWAWLRENERVHRYSFKNVLDWCEQNNERWFRALCNNCGWIVKEYLQSGYWTANTMPAEDVKPDGFSEQAAKLALAPIIARDEHGNRLHVCHECGLVGGDADFAVYGGGDTPNVGICKGCAK